MKMEDVQNLLTQWGEVVVTTSGGQTFELHLGDTEFDSGTRAIHLRAPDAKYTIDGDSIEVVQQHYGHKMD